MKAHFLIAVILLVGCTKHHKPYTGTPVPYGTIYGKNTWENLNDFTTNGVKCAISSKGIIVSPDSLTSTLDYNYCSLLEEWKFAARFKKISDDAIAGLGTRSINAYQSFSVYASINFYSGRLYIHTTNNAVTKTVAKSIDSLLIGTNASIVVSLERKADTLFAVATNGTKAVTAKYVYVCAGYEVPSPNTGKFSIYASKGSFALDSLMITTQALKNANMLIITDSKGMYLADSFRGRWPALVGNVYKPFVLSVGGTDGINELQARLPEIIRLSPRMVLLAVGRNNLAFGMKSDTLKARYERAVKSLTAAGIEVYHLNCIYETEVDQQELSKWIIATFGDNVIDTYTPTTKAHGILGKDGIHPNQKGNDLIAHTIIQSGRFK